LTTDRLIQFEVGDLPSGAVQRFALELIPQRHGPVDLQTRTFFSTTTQSALQVRRPEITIHCQAPETAVYGSDVTFRVVVENIGDGEARNVTLTPHVPQISHIETQRPGELQIPSLAAGQSKEFRFFGRAVQEQWLEANFVASTTDNQQVECGSRVQVLNPELDVELTGTRVCFPEKDGEYLIRVSNPGDTTLRDVTVQLTVPQGLEVTTLSNAADIDHKKRTFTWCFAELQPAAEEILMLRANASKVGKLIQQVVASAEPKLTAQDAHQTTVITRADVDVALMNSREAIEVGEVEEFTVWLVNRGSKVAEQVTIDVQLPEAIQPSTSDKYETLGQTVRFSGIRLAADEEVLLRFHAAGLQAGDHAVRAVVNTDFTNIPTVAETTVFFYDDQELERIAEQTDSPALLR
jgi:hypothetical protein